MVLLHPFLSKTCAFETSINGIYNNQAITKVDGYYRIKQNTAKLTLRQNSKEKFQFIVQGLENMDVLKFKYRVDQSGMVKIIQFIGPNERSKFDMAINNFTLPFRNLIN